MKYLVIISLYIFNAYPITQIVYVESPTDTDSDGKKDLIYVTINRPNVSYKLPTLYTISPYSLGGDNSVQNHNTDHSELPQNIPFSNIKIKTKSKVKYAKVHAHSLGTGYSKGCPTVGDMNETLAGKAVIDWLNGSAKAYNRKGKEVFADWANGNVGMTGVSYNGTLPTMIATTGVKGLKAIIPMAAISNWYNYYRSNGLVVSPGGYIGEDADTLGYYIVRKNTCQSQLTSIFKNLDRKTGDYTKFWQQRNYLEKAKNITAATFIVHGQKDWNVRQRHAIELWEALENTPKKMYLFNGGHSNADHENAVSDWFDYYVAGIENDVNVGPQVWVRDQNNKLIKQYKWPNESTIKKRFYLNKNMELSEDSIIEGSKTIIDFGKKVRISKMINNKDKYSINRLEFLSKKLKQKTILSGTAEIGLELSVENKNSANLTVVVIEYKDNGSTQIITRGWADPQNYSDISKGDLLIKGQKYQINFNLEPKQYTLSKGSRIGVLITSTDYNHTLRPDTGTEINFNLNKNSYIDLNLSN